VNGNECDKAGVGFAAFAKQPDRCGHVRGTCLKNQPLAYRKHDMVRMAGAINETTLEIACPRVAAGVALLQTRARRFKCGRSLRAARFIAHEFNTYTPRKTPRIGGDLFRRRERTVAYKLAIGRQTARRFLYMYL